MAFRIEGWHFNTTFESIIDPCHQRVQLPFVRLNDYDGVGQNSQAIQNMKGQIHWHSL